MTGSPSIAEDVTQEVFVALVRDLARYEPQRAGLSTYLYGVTRNVTRGRLRREQRFVNLDAVPANGPERAGWDDPSAALVRSEGLLRLRKAIVSLPSRFREVVILCDLHGLSYAEAAGVIDARVGRSDRGFIVDAPSWSSVYSISSRKVRTQPPIVRRGVSHEQSRMIRSDHRSRKGTAVARAFAPERAKSFLNRSLLSSAGPPRRQSRRPRRTSHRLASPGRDRTRRAASISRTR
jgi:RNA polymerase sigma factor (sigma-70 family)